MNKRQKLSLISIIIGILALIFSALKLGTDATEYYYDYHAAVEQQGGNDYDYR